MPIKILHVITGLEIGGAETMLFKLIRAMDPAQFSVRVVSLKGKGPIADDLRQNGTPVDSLHVGGPFSALWGMWKLRRLVLDWKPQVVHAWMYHANIFCSVAMEGLKIPLLWGVRYSIRDLSDLKFLTRMLIDLGRVFSRGPKRILYNAQSIADQHEKLGYASHGRVVIPNGIDLEYWSKVQQPSGNLRSKIHDSAQDFIIGMVARFDPQKDFETFLEAAKITAAARKNVQFVLIGPGVTLEQSKLMRMIKDRHLEKIVHLLGEKKDVRSYLRDFDLFTLSSKNGEAFPNVLLEAMAMGIPVVATDVGDCRSILNDDSAVVEVGSPKSLAAAWEKVLSLPTEERLKRGEQGQKRVSQFYSIQTVRTAYQKIYLDVSN